MKRETGKIIFIRVIFIVLLVIIMYFVSRLLCMKTVHGSRQCLGMYAQPRDTVDVVMLGTSHMHYGVNPASGSEACSA